ncbi:hypothetical protein HDU83_009638 [Entophlyctis luteolus]|nr:hypothetical protein HDU83_009638 [Entophlyctis luteolus]
MLLPGHHPRGAAAALSLQLRRHFCVPLPVRRATASPSSKFTSSPHSLANLNILSTSVRWANSASNKSAHSSEASQGFSDGELVRTQHNIEPWSSELPRNLSIYSRPRQRFFSLGEESLDYEGKWRSRLKQLKRESMNQNFKENRTKDLEGSHKVVLLAVSSNACMFIAKLYAATTSGSAAMFAESLHSLADMLNELLLIVGIRRSLREPDVNHPYGFSSEKTAWALVSGVGIFFLGGGVSMYHGLMGLLNPHTIGDATIGFWVLGLSLCFEVVTMSYAYRQISRSALASRMSFFEYLKKGSDPASVQIFLEDCSSIIGILIASVSLSLAKLLAIPMLDSMGSIAIGVLLGTLSTFLVRRNIGSLVERSMDSDRKDYIVAILEADPVVRSLHDVKTTQIGPDWVRFKAEVLFDGDEVARRYLTSTYAENGDLAKELAKVKSFETEEELRAWLIDHGGKVVAKLGTEVDRIELELKSKAPEVKHCDLEIL